VSENVNRVNMLRKAERNLDKALDLPLEDEKLGKLNLDATKFVAKGIGKAIYSERTELTGKDGKDLPTPILGNYVSNNISDQKDSRIEEKN
jgi:hypothetical protein